jgi:hypothetical protein
MMIKINSLSELLLNDDKFSDMVKNNPWGFQITIGKLGTFTATPHPQFNDTFRKNGWSFKQNNQG